MGSGDRHYFFSTTSYQNVLNLLIVLCYYVFVTRKGDLYKCCTPILMDFIKHKVLMFIWDPGFAHLLLAFLEGKSSLSSVGI